MAPRESKLEAILALLEAGWIQEQDSTSDGYCLYGAVRRLKAGLDLPHLNAAADLLAGCSIVHYNDHVAESLEDMRLLVKHAIGFRDDALAA